jgi:hypothetical protein
MTMEARRWLFDWMRGHEMAVGATEAAVLSGSCRGSRNSDAEPGEVGSAERNLARKDREGRAAGRLERLADLGLTAPGAPGKERVEEGRAPPSSLSERPLRR